MLHGKEIQLMQNEVSKPTIGDTCRRCQLARRVTEQRPKSPRHQIARLIEREDTQSDVARVKPETSSIDSGMKPKPNTEVKQLPTAAPSMKPVRRSNINQSKSDNVKGSTVIAWLLWIMVTMDHLLFISHDADRRW